jgi:amino acid adenylation domain-containing protein
MSTRLQDLPHPSSPQPEIAPMEANDREADFEDVLPLSFAQERLWFINRLEPQSPLYNVPLALRLHGELQLPALQFALNAIVARHEVLRTTFSVQNGNPIQVIREVQPVPITQIDLTRASLPEAELTSQLLREARWPFDISRDLMVRATLWRINECDHALLLSFHHIACDEWSLKIFLTELSQLYAARSTSNSASLSELSIQYADFALWQRERIQGEFLEREVQYWLELLDGDIRHLELPPNQPRQPSHRGVTESLAFSPELSQLLRNFSAQQDVTPFMLLLAAFNVLLHRYTGQDDLLVGTPVAGRTNLETEPLIGFFVNTLVLRTRLSPEIPFLELLERVRASTIDAYAHQELPFEKLVAELHPRRNGNSIPLVEVMFAVECMEDEPCKLPGLTVNIIPVDTATAKFDLVFVVRMAGGRWTIVAEYKSDLFDRPSIERFLEHYQTLLEGIVQNPELPIGQLRLLSAKERDQIVTQWNQTAADYPRNATLASLFHEQVARTPEAVALMVGANELTYRELNACANDLAHRLRELSVGPDILVGLCAERSAQTVIGMLAIAKAGGAYLPLDPSYPSERLAFMLDDTQAPVILVQSHLRTTLPPNDAVLVELGDEFSMCDLDPAPIGTPDDLAYAIYTSGSTGRPKGVLIPQRAVVRLVINTDYVRLQASDRIAQASTPNFDAATFEIWGALLNGACVVILDRDVTLSPKDFAKHLREQKITTLFLTTALFNQLALDAPEAFASLKYVLFGGEKVDPKRVRRVLQSHPPQRLLHVYGPTETTTFATWHPVENVEEDAATVPIGKPIANTRAYLLSAAMEPVPIGVTGELYIGGDGLARGYLNQPELTAERFVRDPFSTEAGARLYKTGDLARYQPDGSIEFIGRIDQQVKIRGFRIELGEIESVLRNHPAVRDVEVIARADGPGGSQRLIAYLTFKGARASTPLREIREFLENKLPDYMVPTAWVPLMMLPLNRNGKVDRKSLPSPENQVVTKEGYQAARNSVEHDLIEIWENVLEVRPVGITDNFFELGGHSLLAVRLFAEIEKKFERKLPLSTLFQSPTIEQIGGLLQASGASPSSSLLVGIQPHGAKPPIYWIHSLGGDGGGGFFYYRKLAELLGEEQPSFGIRSPAEPFTSIPQMALHYIREIRQFQPCGPYFLGGFCFGGNVAYEMACQLLAQGETVGLLVLLESAVPGSGSDGSQTQTEHLKSFLLNFRYWWEDLSRQTPYELFCRLRRKQLQLRKKLSRALAPSQNGSPSIELADVMDMSNYPKDYVKYAQAHWQALTQFVPGTYPGRVTLFRARKQPLSLTDPTLGWGRLAAGGVAVNIVPGTHERMLEEPNVQILAAELKACLAEAQVGYSEIDAPPIESDCMCSEASAPTLG